MADTSTIKEAFERNERKLTENPAIGLKTGSASIHLRDGLACDIEVGPWKFTTDMPKNVGGNETGPKPGHLAAGALGSCLAVMVGLFAAKLDVPIDDLTVDVEFDSDARVLFAVGDPPARWRAIRYRITAESTAPEADVRHVLDLAHHWSHVRGDFEHPFTIEREVNIVTPVQS
ncbi:MAG TPA: OsmC family protein [Rhodothermales bacterium]|nr:OsmC family protein [Rhodothermales bacterium]